MQLADVWAFRQRQNEVFKMGLKVQLSFLQLLLRFCVGHLNLPFPFRSPFPLPPSNGSNGPSCLSIESIANCKPLMFINHFSNEQSSWVRSNCHSVLTMEIKARWCLLASNLLVTPGLTTPWPMSGEAVRDSYRGSRAICCLFFKNTRGEGKCFKPWR